jgi:acyl carrier protein
MTDPRTRFLTVITSHFGAVITTQADPLDALIVEDLKPDELDIAEIAMDLEDAFGVSISDDELEPFTVANAHAGKTLRDLLALIEGKVAGKVDA